MWTNEYASIGSDNGVVPGTRRQTIIWTNGGLVHWGTHP